MTEFKTGDELEIEIINQELGNGHGVARVSNFVIFCDSVYKGDKCLVRLTKVKKNFAFADVLQIIEKSPHRIPSPCYHFGECGGCNWLTLNYRRETRLKAELFKTGLKKIAQMDLDDVKFLDIVFSDNFLYYKNKARFKVEEGNIGFFKRYSNDVEHLTHCNIYPSEFFKITNFIARWIREGKNFDVFREIELRMNNKRQVQLIFHMLRKGVPKKELSNLAGNIARDIDCLYSAYFSEDDNMTHIFGRREFAQYVDGQKYLVPPKSFFQTNLYQNKWLAETVKRVGEFDRKDNILDLYCGVGFFSIYLSRWVNQIVGVDSDNAAIIAARKNAAAKAKENMKFITRNCDNLPEDLIEKNKINYIILDPPRKGLDTKLIRQIGKNGVPNIVYISCDPQTFARDIASFDRQGYKLVTAQAVDMFSRTNHLEVVGKLEKK